MKNSLTVAALQAAASGDMENFVVASTPGGIEAQEAAGQKTMVQQEILPIDCRRHDLETLGFVFGEDHDDIFVNVDFPEGWKKVATDHSMWSDLIDNKDRKRGSIFYKAAFYDRSASMNLTTRFLVTKDYTAENYQQYFVIDNATNQNIFESEKYFGDSSDPRIWEEAELLKQTAIDWLDEKYPEHKDALAYWEQK